VSATTVLERGQLNALDQRRGSVYLGSVLG
jgi:hypothetical protein